MLAPVFSQTTSSYSRSCFCVMNIMVLDSVSFMGTPSWMQNYHRFVFAKYFQVCAAVAQGQPVNQVRNQANHERVALQAYLDEIGNLVWISNWFGKGIKFLSLYLNVDLWVGKDILEPISHLLLYKTH